MPATFTPTTPTLIDLAIGRGIVFRSAYWNGTGNLTLTHLGDTEGEISITPEDAIERLTTPETSGDATRKARVKNGGVTVRIPLFIGDPAKRAIVSPTGNASSGYSRGRQVQYHTLAIFPEDLLLNPTSQAYEALAKAAAGAWTVGGVALTAEQTAMLGQAVWIWKAFFSRPPVVLRDGDAGKSVQEVTATAVLDTTKPEGHMLYTIGDPTPAGIIIATT